MSNLNDLPHRLRAAVVKEFEGERIVWTGRPGAGRAFLATLPIWLFAIPWTVFSVGWTGFALFAGLLSGKPPPSTAQSMMAVVFPLFGLPFVLIGIYMLAMPLRAWLGARNTVHVLGDRRFATVTVGRKLKVKSFMTSAITHTERTERRDGSGTLKVVFGNKRDSEGDKVEEAEVLYGIRDVRKAERLVRARIDDDRHAA